MIVIIIYYDDADDHNWPTLLRWERRNQGLGREERTAMQASDLLVSLVNNRKIIWIYIIQNHHLQNENDQTQNHGQCCRPTWETPSLTNRGPRQRSWPWVQHALLWQVTHYSDLGSIVSNFFQESQHGWRLGRACTWTGSAKCWERFYFCPNHMMSL